MAKPEAQAVPIDGFPYGVSAAKNCYAPTHLSLPWRNNPYPVQKCTQGSTAAAAQHPAWRQRIRYAYSARCVGQAPSIVRRTGGSGPCVAVQGFFDLATLTAQLAKAAPRPRSNTVN